MHINNYLGFVNGVKQKDTTNFGITKFDSTSLKKKRVSVKQLTVTLVSL